MQTSQNSKTMLPLEVSSQLPIFQILGNQLPDKMKTPAAKKTGAKLVFWAVFLIVGYMFFKALPTLIAFARMSILLTVYSIIAAVLILLFPKIVSLLHRLGQILIFKADKAITEKYSIETLRLLLRSAEDTQKVVRERITQVQSVRINMVTESEKQNQEAEESFARVVKLTGKAKEADNQSVKEASDGNSTKSRDLKRQASEFRVSATLSKSEGEAAKLVASSYAQYANNFGTALEILKDNESSVKIYVSSLTSSVNIAEKKSTATAKMRQATDGLADIFQIEDTALFQTAMDAVTAKISDDLAHVQRNLEFVSESRLNTIDSTKSQEELELFVNQLNSGQIKKLDVQEVSSPSHELTSEEKVDKSFNILD